MKLIGPATITHDGTNIGKTKGGGELTFLSFTYEVISNTYKREKVIYGVEGEIHKFEITSQIVSSSEVMYDYGEIIITLSSGSITLHNAKIFVPDELSFGTNSQEVFTLGIVGGENTSGNVYTIN